MKQVISVQFTRKRQKLTNYRSRLKLLSSGKDRLVIRKTSRNLIIQLARYSDKGDVVELSVTSKTLGKYGWSLSCKNIPAAYLTGFLFGRAALAKGVKNAILDAGTSKPVSSGRIYAALKGVIDAGISVPASPEIFPKAERLSGLHISSYLKSASGSQFSAYRKAKLSESAIGELVKSVKSKISGDKK